MPIRCIGGPARFSGAPMKDPSAVNPLKSIFMAGLKCRTAYPDELLASVVDGALPFDYELTGAVTRFSSGLDPVSAS